MASGQGEADAMIVRIGGKDYPFGACEPCAAEILARRAMNGYRATELSLIFFMAVPGRDCLDREERGPQARAVFRALTRHGMALDDLPALCVDDRVQPVYRPFAPCDRCQAQLAEFTDSESGMVFLSAALEARLARFVNPRRGKLSKAATGEIRALSESAIWAIGRLIAPRVGWSWDYPENWLDEGVSGR